MMKKFVVMTAVLTSLAAGAETFQVSPGNDSFGKAAKNWKTGDTILLAPGRISGHTPLRQQGTAVLRRVDSPRRHSRAPWCSAATGTRLNSKTVAAECGKHGGKAFPKLFSNATP